MVVLHAKPLLPILARRGEEPAAKGPAERLVIPITTFQRHFHHGDAANAERPGILAWLVYAFVDVAVLAGSGVTLRMGALVAVSLLTKLVSAYLGALAASWRA